jgi:hypothetical protein
MINILDLPQTNSFGGFPPNSEEQVTKMIKILKVIDPVFFFMEKTHERCPVESAYVGEALASVLRNSPMMKSKNAGYDLADGTEVKTSTFKVHCRTGKQQCTFTGLRGKEEHGAERFMFIVSNPLKNRVEIYTMSVAKFKERWGNTNSMGSTYKKQARRFETLENVADRMQVIDENGLRDVL